MTEIDTETEIELQPGDALLVVDVQNDFCPGGALPIDNGDQVVAVLNRWIDAALAAAVPVYLSRDWHPLAHISFAERGGPWPPHCLQDSEGARFHPQLRIPDTAVKVTKGVRFDQDQNSAFDQTGLGARLADDGVRRLFVGGLAEDVCVSATVIDGCRAGFEVWLIAAATRATTPENGERARAEMRAAGAGVI